jgi:redox-sensing transcriptional repressor
MVKGGIEAIWNFAPLKLEVPEHICVQDEDLYSSLASLVQKLSR